MPKVLIADDHSILLFAVRTLLERDGYQVVGEARDGSTAIEMCRKLQPDLLILDLGLPKLDGLGVMERLNALDNPPRVVVLTGKPSALYARRSIHAGAWAYISKDDCLDTLRDALRAVMSNYKYLPNNLLPNEQRIADANTSEQELMDRLSNREIEVLSLLVKGASNTHIAETMLLSAKTVSTYKTRIMEKLQVGSLVEMVELANRHNLN